MATHEHAQAVHDGSRSPKILDVVVNRRLPATVRVIQVRFQSPFSIGNGQLGTFRNHQGIGADLGGSSSLSAGIGLLSEDAETPKGSDNSPTGNQDEYPVGKDWRSWGRVALSAVLFYAGCLLAYRSEFSTNSAKLIDYRSPAIFAYLLVVSGLVCGFWEFL